jgi:hypothetical protein
MFALDIDTITSNLALLAVTEKEDHLFRDFKLSQRQTKETLQSETKKQNKKTSILC